MRFYPKSLNKLLLLHELTFLLLVVVTGALGGIWAYYWQQSSQESLRINSLLFGAHQVRGDLYREIKEVTRARLAQDPNALEQYWQHLYSIERRFNQLQQSAVQPEEKAAIDAMRQSYSLMQTQMNRMFADDSLTSDAIRASVLEPAYEEWMLGDFESAFGQFTTLISARSRELETRLAFWTRLAPVLTPIPIVLAVVLLFISHRSLKRRFVRPMADIAAGAGEISEGNLQHKIPEHGAAEVQRIATSINEMAGELASSRAVLVQNERQSALGSLVPVVAHNIRNPLASIRATAQVLDERDDPAELRDTRQSIIDSVDRLERWLKSLLSYLHPLQPHASQAPLSTAADGALIALGPRLEEKNISVEKLSWDQDPVLNYDVDLLEQAVYGLLANAIDASPQAAELTLSLVRSIDGVTLVIDDEGSGMPMKPQPSDLSPGPSTKRFGTGLGIPFAYKVVRQHGGDLVFTQAPGGGTRVRLTMPSSETRQGAAA